MIYLSDTTNIQSVRDVVFKLKNFLIPKEVIIIDQIILRIPGYGDYCSYDLRDLKIDENIMYQTRAYYLFHSSSIGSYRAFNISQLKQMFEEILKQTATMLRCCCRMITYSMTIGDKESIKKLQEIGVILTKAESKIRDARRQYALYFHPEQSSMIE